MVQYSPSRRKRLVCSTAQRRTASGLAPWRRTGKTLGSPACRPARRRGPHRNGCPSRRRGREPCSRPGSVRGRPARRCARPRGRRCRARRRRPSRTRRCAPRRAPTAPSARPRPRCPGRTDGTGGAVEHREDTAVEMLDLLTAEAGEMGPDVPVVGGQQLTPGVVTQVDGLGVESAMSVKTRVSSRRRRGSGSAIRRGSPAPRPGRPRRRRRRGGWSPLQLDEAGIGDLGRDLASIAHRDQAVVTAVEHQGGHPHSGEDIDEVVGVERRQQRQDGAAAHRLPRVLGHSVNGSSPAMLGAHSRTAQSLRIPQPRLTASTKPASVPSPTPAGCRTSAW